MICRQLEENIKGNCVQWEYEAEGCVQGKLELFPCAVYIEGERVECAWLTMNADNPQAEKMLLHTAVDYVQEKQIPVCMCLGKNAGLFESEGFLMRERQSAVLEIASEWKNERFSLRPAEERDCICLRGLYSLYAGDFDATVVRGSEEYWKEHVLPRLKNLSVVEKEGQIVAYIDYEIESERIFVKEFAAHTDYDVLLCAVSLAANGVREAVMPLPILENKAVSEKQIFCEEAKLFFRVNRPFLFKGSRIKEENVPQNFIGDIVCWDAFR